MMAPVQPPDSAVKVPLFLSVMRAFGFLLSKDCSARDSSQKQHECDDWSTARAGSYNPSHDVIRSSHSSDRGGDLWGAGTGNHGLLPRWLSGFDRAWICWR